jgi:hypothetical protein
MLAPVALPAPRGDCDPERQASHQHCSGVGQREWTSPQSQHNDSTRRQELHS